MKIRNLVYYTIFIVIIIFIVNKINISATCRVRSRTGVEMEALIAASVTAMTVYDMCKAVDRSMIISDLRVIHKSGGKSGQFNQD